MNSHYDLFLLQPLSKAVLTRGDRSASRVKEGLRNVCFAYNRSVIIYITSIALPESFISSVVFIYLYATFYLLVNSHISVYGDQ